MGNQVSTNLPEDWATVEMFAQHAYCSRRFHLMDAEGRWDDNLHTIAGKAAHRRVEFDEKLLADTRETIAAARAGRCATELPAPLEDSPKLWGDSSSARDCRSSLPAVPAIAETLWPTRYDKAES